MNQTQSRQVSELIDSVEEMLAELRDEHSPQIGELRNRIKIDHRWHVSGVTRVQGMITSQGTLAWGV
jgi:hypothetical protein